MPADSIQKTTARNGEPNIELCGIPYHSVYNPSREAAAFYDVKGIGNASLIIQFGRGLGYGDEELIRRLGPDARAVILEPNPTVAALAPKLSDRRVHMLSGADVCRLPDYIATESVNDTDRILWLTWPAAQKLYPSQLAEARERLRSRLRDLAANLLTHFKNGDLYFRNALRNLRWAGSPDIARLFGRFQGVPIVIVSAGPSLDRNMKRLRDIRQRCLLLSVDTALRPLLREGIVPHAVIVADPTELNAGHVRSILPPETWLFAEQGVHPSVLDSAAERYLFSVGVFPDPLLEEFGLRKSALDVWGSVATAALDFACRSGSDTVIFVGQDLAYSWGKEYVDHTQFFGRHFDVHSRQTQQLDDVWGLKVHTSEDLAAYRDFFVRKIRAHSSIRFINASEGGILRDAVEVLPLDDALFRYCKRRVDPSSILRSCYLEVEHIHELPGHLRSVLKRRSLDCGCFSGFLELVAKRETMNGDDAGIQLRIADGIREIENLTEAAQTVDHSSTVAEVGAT